jgi:hypothetical protein
MFIKSLQIVFVGLVLSVATAWAGPSAIQGVVKDAKGQAIKGADVRIESRDGKELFKTVKTDRNGRYVSDGLAAGVYRVTVGREWRRESVNHEHEDSSGSVDATEFRPKTGVGSASKRRCKERKTYGLGAIEYRKPHWRSLGLKLTRMGTLKQAP